MVLLAVHPEVQKWGIATQLNLAALDEMKAAGMKMAIAETGSDDGHASARRAYESAGYTGLPIVCYSKDLQPHRKREPSPQSARSARRTRRVLRR